VSHPKFIVGEAHITVIGGSPPDQSLFSMEKHRKALEGRSPKGAEGK